MSVVAIDPGYGYVKVMADNGQKFAFPSWVAPAGSLYLREALKVCDPGYVVAIKEPQELKEEYLVGELALKEGGLAGHALHRDKWGHWTTQILVLTALALVEAEPPVTVVTGLPLNTYSGQKDKVAEILKDLRASVTVNGKARRLVQVDRPLVFLQGAGAIYALNTFPAGRQVVVDVGQFTTNVVCFEVAGGKITPVVHLSGSIEKGVITLNTAFQKAFLNRYQVMLEPGMTEATLRSGSIPFRGQEVDITGLAADARIQAARAIGDAVTGLLHGDWDFIQNTILCGGGALAMKDEFERLLPRVTVMEDSQFANVRGYLRVGQLAGNADG